MVAQVVFGECQAVSYWLLAVSYIFTHPLLYSFTISTAI
jgi:hypothetical protein